MARTARKTNGQTNGTGARAENVAPYFRALFQTEPKLLKQRSNKVPLERWHADHPQFKEIPDNVKTGLANIKSVMRKGLRKRRGRKAAAAEPAAAGAVRSAGPVFLSRTAADRKLEQLEIQIDECLTLAKNLDREGLAGVIHTLRRARNAVVWKAGGEA
jgi:hypothetical protein